MPRRKKGVNKMKGIQGMKRERKVLKE